MEVKEPKYQIGQSVWYNDSPYEVLVKERKIEKILIDGTIPGDICYKYIIGDRSFTGHEFFTTKNS